MNMDYGVKPLHHLFYVEVLLSECMLLDMHV